MRKPLAVAVWMLALLDRRSAATLAAETSMGITSKVVGSVRRLQKHTSVPSCCFVQSNRHCRSARTNSNVTCRLFFRATDFPPRRKVAPPDWALQQIKSRDISVPFTFPVDGNKKTSSTLTVRCMTEDDFDTIVPMCITEFGTGPTASLADFPWRDPTDRKLTDWWDRIYFEPMVTMALKAKLQGNRGRRLLPPFGDPTVLVLTRQEKDVSNSPPVVVGMVELSKQAPESTKNPPAFPTPLWGKQLYCQLTGMQLEGWVTNLLIGKEHRGMGYSKILMEATEGIAKSWNVGSIYLHADADRSSGKVPQSLYEGLGYQVVVTSDNPQFEWMGGDFASRINIVDGVPLLFLRKRLKR
jgi:ribosomal protein S18 acetylase RimI-like enzyme